MKHRINPIALRVFAAAIIAGFTCKLLIEILGALEVAGAAVDVITVLISIYAGHTLANVIVKKEQS